MSENQQDETLYDTNEDSPAQRVGDGPTTPSAPTKMSNISAVVKGAKTGKVMLLTGGAVVLVVALLAVALLSSKKQVRLPEVVSGVDVGAVPALHEQPNKDLVESAQYKAMVDQVNAGRAADAAKNGTSVQPLADGTARTLVDFKTPSQLEREQKIADDLEASKASAKALEAQLTRPVVAPQGQPQQGQQQVDPVYANMMNAAAGAMGELLTPRAHGMQSFDVSSPPKVVLASAATTGVQAGSVSGGALASGAVAAPRGKTLIAAGTVAAARMDTAVNTDIGGDFVATLVTGPYAGAKLIGASTRAGEVASMTFKIMSLPTDGVSMPVSAVALDSESLEAGTATDVDRKLLVKYAVKPIVAGIAAVGQALLTAGTSVAVNGTEVVSSKPAITSSQARNIVIGSGAQQINSDASAFNTTPTVRVAPGTVIGVMFTADVVYTPTTK